MKDNSVKEWLLTLPESERREVKKLLSDASAKPKVERPIYDKNDLSKLVTRAVKRIRNETMDMHRKAVEHYVHYAINTQWVVFSSWVAGVFADLGDKGAGLSGFKVVAALRKGDYVSANEAMCRTFEEYADHHMERFVSDETRERTLIIEWLRREYSDQVDEMVQAIARGDHHLPVKDAK